jgi:hypothetical protein
MKRSLSLICSIGVTCAVVTVARAGHEPPSWHITPVQSVTATSTLDKEHSAERALSHGVWCEGKADEGIGEGISIRFDGPVDMSSITVSQKEDPLRAEHNVVTAVNVGVGVDNQAREAQLSDGSVTVPIAARVRELRVTIARVARGKRNDSCFGVTVMTATPGSLVLGAPAARADDLEAAVDRIVRAFVASDAKALAALIQFPLEVGSVTFKSVEELAAALKAHKLGRLAPNTVTMDGLLGVDAIFIEACSDRCNSWSVAPRADGWRLVGIGR